MGLFAFCSGALFSYRVRRLFEQVGVFEDVVGGAFAADAQQEVLVHQVREVAADGLGADVGAEGLVFAVGDPALLDEVAQGLFLTRY